MRFLSDGSTTATPDHTRHARTHFLPLWCKCVSRLYGVCECVCVCLEGSSFAGLCASYCESQSATTGGGGDGCIRRYSRETRRGQEERRKSNSRIAAHHPPRGCRVQLSPSFARNPEGGGRRAEDGRPTDRCWPARYPRVVACEDRGQASPVADCLDRRRPPAQIRPRQLLPSGAPSGGTPDSCWPGWPEMPRGYPGAIGWGRMTPADLAPKMKERRGRE